MIKILKSLINRLRYIMEKRYKLNDKVVMKKPHACQTNEWLITRTGVDILEFEKKLKKIIGDNNE